MDTGSPSNPTYTQKRTLRRREGLKSPTCFLAVPVAMIAGYTWRDILSQGAFSKTTHDPNHRQPKLCPRGCTPLTIPPYPFANWPHCALQRELLPISRTS